MIVDDNVCRQARDASRLQLPALEARRSRFANDRVERLNISALQRKARIVELSGGDRQKVVLAEALAQDPSIVALDEPTRGVDVGTIPHVHAEIRRLADEGKAAVVVISSYLREILVRVRPHPCRPHRAYRRRIRYRGGDPDKILNAAVH